MQLLDCPEQETGAIYVGITRYNHSQVPLTQKERFVPIRKKIVDDQGHIIAGCLAEMYCWHIVWVDVLWVDEPYRKQGLGSQLLQAVEDDARRAGCELIHLDTFDFQAKDFYLRHGYEVFGILEDCPKGHCRYNLKKTLTPC